ncbi:MAG: hypothetical protein ACU0GG_18565 [Paracoccaceae bacterium]
MRFSLICLFVFAVSAAFASPIEVTASYKDDVTRVMLRFDERPRWTIQNRGRIFQIRLLQVAPFEFDLSRLPEHLEGGHTLEIRAVGNNTLEIEVACNCLVQPGQITSQSMVFDVVPVRSMQPNVSFASPNLVAPEIGELALMLPKTNPRPLTGLNVPSTLGDHVVQPTALRDSIGAPSRTSLDLPKLDTAHGPAVELVANALARAAAQGLISADPAIDGLRSLRTHSNFDSLAGRGNLAVSTGFDPAIRSEIRNTPPTASGQFCIPTSQIDVVEWGDVADGLMLGRLRHSAIAEDGSVIPEGAMELARYYIYLGFGTEARRTVEFLKPSRDREIVLTLADVMDYGLTRRDTLEGQWGCAGPVSLWAALSTPVHHAAQPESTDDMLSTFSALPAHLRSHLGPLLSNRLHEAGLGSEARTAINAVTRGGKISEESTLAVARLELEGTHAHGARETLVELSNSTSLTAGSALLELLVDAEAREMAPNPAWVDDAPSLIDVLEGTEVAERLNIARLKGLISLGDFQSFRSEVGKQSPGLTSVVRHDLSVRALRVAAEEAGDAQFLKTEIAVRLLAPPETLDDQTRLKIARRFLQLGLSSRAADYASRSPKNHSELNVAVDVNLLSGNVIAALELARQSALSDTAGLLARTQVAAGEDAAAIHSYSRAGDFENAKAAAVRTGSWNWLAKNGEDQISEAIKGLLQPMQKAPTDKVVENGALIANTRHRRDKIRELLSFVRAKN